MYIDEDTLDDLFPEWRDSDNSGRLLLSANAWLSKHGLVFTGDTPEPIKQAGALIARAAASGGLYASRAEGAVRAKTVKAGEVSVHKEYVGGTDGAAMSAEEQLALDLIAPYVNVVFHRVEVTRA